MSERQRALAVLGELYLAFRALQDQHAATTEALAAAQAELAARAAGAPDPPDPVTDG